MAPIPWTSALAGSPPLSLAVTAKACLSAIAFVGAAFWVGVCIQYVYVTYNDERAAYRSPHRLAAVLHWPQKDLPAWAPIDINQLTCSSTKIEPYLIADSNGLVCLRDHQLDNGCCSAGLTISACKEGCSDTWKCCKRHSLCVSCCLSKYPNSDDIAKSRQRFQICSHQCQFTSASTVSGNRFKHDLKYCYELVNNDKLPFGLATTILSEPGMSCTMACNTLGLGCDESFLEAINRCDSFQASGFYCPSGCRTAESRDAPGVIDNECFLNAKAHLLDCDSARHNFRRLCSCLPDEINPDSVHFDHEDYPPAILA